MIIYALGSAHVKVRRMNRSDLLRSIRQAQLHSKDRQGRPK